MNDPLYYSVIAFVGVFAALFCVIVVHYALKSQKRFTDRTIRETLQWLPYTFASLIILIEIEVFFEVTGYNTLPYVWVKLIPIFTTLFCFYMGVKSIIKMSDIFTFGGREAEERFARVFIKQEPEKKKRREKYGK
jgi:Na+/H+ antiporter NhaC